MAPWGGGVHPSGSASPCLATWVNGPPSLSPFPPTVACTCCDLGGKVGPAVGP